MAIGLFRFLKGIILEQESDETKRLQIQPSSAATTGTTFTITAAPTVSRTQTFQDVDGDILARNSSDSTVNVNSARITNLATPTSAGDAVTKTYADGIALGTQFTDTNFQVHNAIDVTKTLVLDISQVSTATTRTLIVPNANTTIVGTDSAQAITNKTSIGVDNLLLDGNTISSTNSNGNIILDPNGTGSVTTDTSIKLLSGVDPRLAISGIAVSTPSGGFASAVYNETATTGTPRNIAIFSSNDSAVDANATGAVLIESGNKSAGTGNSGPITIKSGTSSSGARGPITLESTSVIINASTTVVQSGVEITGTLSQTGVTTYQQNTTPAIPASGFNKFYVKSDNQFYNRDVFGHERVFGTPTGAIIDFAGSTAPAGFFMCYGQILSQSIHPALFAIIGSTYNTGGEIAGEFRLPDVRGRVTAGRDDMGGSAANRLTNTVMTPNGNTLGATGGAQTHSLIASENGPHVHTYTQKSNNAGIAGADTGLTGSSSNTFGNFQQTTDSQGSGTAHLNTQPTIIFNKIIKY